MTETSCVGCDSTDGYSHTSTYALHWAADRGCMVCVKRFVEKIKICPSHTSTSGETPLYDAVRNGHLEIARQLLDYKAQVDIAWHGHGAAGNNGYQPLTPLGNNGYLPLTPLAYISRSEHTPDTIALAKLLIDRGAKTTNIKVHWVKVIFECHKNCKSSVTTFLGIRKKSALTRNARDTHCIIAKMLWSTRFEKIWMDNLTDGVLRPFERLSETLRGSDQRLTAMQLLVYENIRTNV